MAPSRPISLTRRLPVFYGWVIVAAGFIVWIFSVGQTYTFGIFFKPVAEEMGWSRAETSLAFSIRSLSMGLSASLFGLMTDRYGPRLVVILGGAILGVAYGLLSLTGGLAQYYALFLVIGMGSSACSQSSVVATVSRWFHERRGLAVSIMTMGGGLGQVVMPFFVVFFILNFDWRVAYLMLGIVMGVIIIGVAQLLRRDPQEKGLLPYGWKEGASPTAQPAAQGFSSKQAVLSRNFGLAFLGQSIMTVAHMMVMMHLVNYATDPGIGISRGVAASFLSIIGATNVLGKAIVGSLSDRLGRRVTLTLCYALAAATLIWLLFARDLWAFYIFAIFYGIAYGGWIPMAPALLGDLFGMRSIGAIIGVEQLAGAGGGALGAWLGGYIFDVTQSYTLAFILGGTLFAGAALAILAVRPPRLKAA